MHAFITFGEIGVHAQENDTHVLSLLFQICMYSDHDFAQNIMVKINSSTIILTIPLSLIFIPLGHSLKMRI